MQIGGEYSWRPFNDDLEVGRLFLFENDTELGVGIRCVEAGPPRHGRINKHLLQLGRIGDNRYLPTVKPDLQVKHVLDLGEVRFVPDVLYGVPENTHRARRLYIGKSDYNLGVLFNDGVGYLDVKTGKSRKQ